jgi:glucosyl-3-phosphoglycerate synthase
MISKNGGVDLADFFQNGVITTLHNVGNRTLESIEDELIEFSNRRNMTLVIPALYSEFENKPIYNILDELKKVKYLYKIVIGLDRATREQFLHVKSLVKDFPTPIDVIWNEGERIQALLKKLEDGGFKGMDYRGKGRNVWIATGYVLTDVDSYAIALHDADIINYTREIPARLLYPVVHPALDFEFNKGYYARVSGKLHGRVMRLFFTPLIKAIEKTLGKSSYLDYMDSFRYSLSGEFAYIRSLARGMRISPTWGLEVSTLSEVYNNTSTNRICQTQITESYEHKHQNMTKDYIDQGILKMADEIAQAIYREISQQGFTFTPYNMKTIISAYHREARLAIAKYNALSKINGLSYMRQVEFETINAFEQTLQSANDTFLEDPMGVSTLPAWTAVRSVFPEFSDEFREAVQLDNEEKV